MKIIEVYNQLSKEELGTDKAIFLYGEDDKYRAMITGILCHNMDGTSTVIAWPCDHLGATMASPICFSGECSEVEWVGNKPKAKKLEEFLISFKGGHYFTYYKNLQAAIEDTKGKADVVENWKRLEYGSIEIGE